MSMPCPHCKQTALIRTSQQISPLLRELRYACRNDDCGHTFVAYTEVSYTTSPSAQPDPAINLPFSKHVKRRELIGQLTLAPQAQPLTEPAESAQVASACETITSAQVSRCVARFASAYQMDLAAGRFPGPINPGHTTLLWLSADVQRWINQQPTPEEAKP